MRGHPNGTPSPQARRPRQDGLAAFLDSHADVMRVRITGVKGSSPRDAGAQMFVASGAIHGTIGGGQLEFRAIAEARALLGRGEDQGAMDVPLGPEIGQCCGGRVQLALDRFDAPAKNAAIEDEEAARSRDPQVFIFGAGHVGRALATALALLPVRPVLIDSRGDEMALARGDAEQRLTPLPEAEVARAPKGSAFVILTHDHALDFLITAEALKRGDAAYVGMIGSATKRAKFASWCRDEADAQNTDALTCPIGGPGVGDKRPEVIAAFVAAEVMAALNARAAQEKTTEA